MMSHNKEHGKRIVNISCAINNDLHSFSSLIRGKEKKGSMHKKDCINFWNLSPHPTSTQP